MDLQSIMIGSEDPAKLTEFYTKAFGKPAWDDGGFTGWQVGSGFLMVGPHSEIKGTSAEPARIMVGFVTTTVEDDFQRLSDLGAKTVAKPYHPGGDDNMWLATLADPDGNYFQLMTPWEGGDAK